MLSPPLQLNSQYIEIFQLLCFLQLKHQKEKVFEEPRKLILLNLLMKTPLCLYHQLEYCHWSGPESDRAC